MDDRSKDGEKHETMAGTVGGHVNDDHDHPGGETPTGAKLDQTATRSRGKTGEDGALAGGPAPGHGRASDGDPGGAGIAGDVAARTPESDALQGAGRDRSTVEQEGGTTTGPGETGGGSRGRD